MDRDPLLDDTLSPLEAPLADDGPDASPSWGLPLQEPGLRWLLDAAASEGLALELWTPDADGLWSARPLTETGGAAPLLARHATATTARLTQRPTCRGVRSALTLHHPSGRPAARIVAATLPEPAAWRALLVAALDR